MEKQFYNWKRFWVPTSGSINLSDGGYLPDPETDWGERVNPQIVSFESLVHVPCLALLGEPGMGKSTAMEDDYHYVVHQLAEPALCFDLGQYDSDSYLVRDIFEGAELRAWLEGEHRLHLFLDSLDEGRLSVKSIIKLLLNAFRKLPIGRLRLRIACRTADWPNAFENGLRNLWGKENVSVYEIAPLRRADVIEAASAYGIDSEAFLRQVHQVDVVPFAIKPVTLEFLLKKFVENESLPTTQVELYTEGCRQLCAETAERSEARGAGRYNADQRLIVASRIAALTIFSNKAAIWKTEDRGSAQDGDITLHELRGGEENADGLLEITDNALLETINTGLFSSRGTNRMGWSHQTYAEFLAARYLVANDMPLVQIMSLISHPGDPNGRIVPQLHQTAAWIAAMRPDVFRKLAVVDPEVLLRSDVSLINEEDKATLIRSLLDLYDEELAMKPSWLIRERFRELNYPGLADLLREYLCDKTKSPFAQKAAIDIAETCNVYELQDDFVSIALDLSMHSAVREDAAGAVIEIGNSEAKAKLSPLVFGELGDDPYDSLWGYGLQALWPEHITAEELFRILRPPRRRLFGGSYQRFLSTELARHLQPSDLPLALQWVTEFGLRYDLRDEVDDLADSIMLLGWEHIGYQDILTHFANAALSRLVHFESIVGRREYGEDSALLRFTEELSTDQSRRHPLLGALVSLIASKGIEPYCLLYSGGPRLILDNDLEWLLSLFSSDLSKEEQEVITQLVLRVTDFYNTSQVESVFRASEENQLLRMELENKLHPIELGADEAEKLREQYQRLQELERPKPHQVLDPPPADQIQELLDGCEAGKISLWEPLTIWLTLEPDQAVYDNRFYTYTTPPDLTLLPGWEAANSTIRSKILKAAKQYILNPPRDLNIYIRNSWNAYDLAGYKALRLLLKTDNHFISSLQHDVWAYWMPLILTYPMSSEEYKETDRELKHIAYLNAPDEFLQTLTKIIDEENAKEGYISVEGKIDGLWDERISDFLMEKVLDNQLRPDLMGQILELLLEHGVNEAKEFALSSLLTISAEDENEKHRAIIVATKLVMITEDASWEAVWEVIRQNSQFGRELVGRIAGRYHKTAEKLANCLSANEIADLYIWLVEHYPHADDPTHEAGVMYAVTTRDEIIEFRDRLLYQLVERGAATAIRRIVNSMSEAHRIRRQLLEAETNARRLTWEPYSPATILELAKNHQLRVIESGHQLLNEIISSLDGLENKLQEEKNPAIRDLWNRWEGRWRPKDENDLSSYIARHLISDLRETRIIVNREVEIRRGEETDIFVEAFIMDAQGICKDTITAIIEVKGSWHREVNSAMETQLVERYMRTSFCRHGVYLVGWFNCEAWDDGDYRKTDAISRVPNLAAARSSYNAQAAQLSSGNIEVKAYALNTSLP